MNIIPTDVQSIYEKLNNPDANPSKIAIVRPNNPPPGIAGFLFDVTNDDTAELESDITDYFVEDNTSIQDHIALRPETVTVTAEAAELVMAMPVASSPVSHDNPLPLVGGLQPQLAPGAQAQQVRLQKVTVATNAGTAGANSLFGYYIAPFLQQKEQTKQSLIFGYIYQLWKGRQLFSVETPWGFFTNMAILSVTAHQGPTNRVVSDFSITFKKIRVAHSITITPGLIAGRASFQQSEVTQDGTIGLTPVTTAQASAFDQKTWSLSK